MSYFGDIRLSDTIDIKFVTTAAATGAPTQLAGTPVISAYPGNSTTQVTTGITLSVDFDGVTGLNNCRVVASGANGYATATNYALVITTGTVGGTSAVGYVIGSFSIEARSALMPTTAARTLDVSAGGEAGVDWANVGSPTTTVGLSNTTVGTATALGTGAVNATSVADGAIDAGAIASNAITDAKIATGAITAAKFAASAIDAAALATDAVNEIQSGLATSSALATAQADLDTITGADGVVIASGTQTFDMTGSITGNITGNLSGSVGSVTGAVGSVTGAVGSVTGAVGSVTGNVGGNVTGTVGGLTTQAMAQFFTLDSGETYASSVAGSVVQEIADNAGGSALTVQAIVDGVWDEARASHATAGTFGEGAASVQGNVTGDVQGNVDGSVASVTAETTANVSKINSTAVTGTGTAGDLWRGA